MSAIVVALGNVWTTVATSPVGLYVGNVIHAVLPCIK